MHSTKNFCVCMHICVPLGTVLSSAVRLNVHGRSKADRRGVVGEREKVRVDLLDCDKNILTAFGAA